MNDFEKDDLEGARLTADLAMYGLTTLVQVLTLEGVLHETSISAIRSVLLRHIGSRHINDDRRAKTSQFVEGLFGQAIEDARTHYKGHLGKE